jgi:UDP-glucose 4-epimerase
MRVLVTGGAGFIGSHIVADRLRDGDEVVVIDDLTTGFRENVPADVRLVAGSVADPDAVKDAMVGVDLVHHHAAARAVLRSVEDPIGTDRVNTGGTLNVLTAAREAGARRVIIASSSSVYGGVAPTPTPEDAPLRPKSPYAVSKLAGEHYARVFSKLYELETVALRYFNVFGPRQRPDSPYAAVIPLFIDALADGDPPVVHGDGLQSRDFTYISDVVRANRFAATAPADRASGEVYNIARGEPSTLLELIGHIQRIMGVDVAPVHTAPRAGDIRMSCADASRARADLGFDPEVSFGEGLERVVDWYLGWRSNP